MRKTFLLALLAFTALASALLQPSPGPATAAGGNSITSPDTADDVGRYPSLALDALGNPVVSYNDQTNGDLKVLHCNDATCSGGDESITSPDTAGLVGYDTSLVLDAAGYPVVSYRDYTGGALKILHCGNANCTSGNSITSPDTGVKVGLYTSLALDASGYPVVSYFNVIGPTQGLNVLHCNDPNCSGNDDSITLVDPGQSIGYFTSLALDAAGYPVVSYVDASSGLSSDAVLKVLHCNDANCTGGDESITSLDTTGSVGYKPSIVIDTEGYPVVSYYKGGQLRVLRCNDANCSGGDESITAVDSAFTASATYTSRALALDASGNPVVTYWSFDLPTLTYLGLKVLHCGNANCTDDNSIIAADTSSVGGSASLALDAGGDPVVSYWDSTNKDLKVLHCGDPNCTGAKPPPAVLLVHGYGGSCGTFSNLEPWLEQALVDSGDFTDLATAQERVKCFDPLGGGSGYDYSQGTWLSALSLGSYVQQFLDDMAPVRDGKIDIVAHSFGGLVSRFYIEVIGADFTVSSLTMLGTPNEGTAFANAALWLDRFGGPIDDIAAWDMRPDSNNPGGLLHLLNDGFTAPSTSYRTVAGTHCRLPLNPCYFWLDLPNDCLVSEDSVMGPFPGGTTVSRDVSHPAKCTVLTPFLTNDPPSSNCASDPDHTFCDVLSMVSSSGSGASAGTSSAVGEVSGQAASAGAGLGLMGGHVNPGGSGVHQMEVDASAASVEFILFWEGSTNAIALQLERPDSSVVSPSDSGVTHSPPAEIVPGFVAETYQIALPEAGQWTVRVEDVSVPAGGLDYVVSAHLDSPVTMTVSPNPASATVGQAVIVSGTLQESGAAILGATMNATVTLPDSTEQVVALADDGVTPDAQADDGIYTAAFGDTAGCGVYAFDVVAQGVASTGPFVRGDIAFVEMYQLDHLFGDPCSADYDADGCTDSTELGTDETLGGLRDPLNPWDFYDVDGLGGPDGEIDLFNDILGVINHYSLDGSPPYDVQFDRGPSSGPNPWNMTAPDGSIDLFTDILGVIQQHGHDCR